METPEKFLIFQEAETQKYLLCFRKQNLPYISGKEYSELWHNRTFLIFQKKDIQNPGITELSYISGN